MQVVLGFDDCLGYRDVVELVSGCVQGDSLSYRNDSSAAESSKAMTIRCAGKSGAIHSTESV